MNHSSTTGLRKQELLAVCVDHIDSVTLRSHGLSMTGTGLELRFMLPAHAAI